jgi:DNA-binding transcriptional LysR family regulator
MDIHHIRYFLAVSETRNFTRAAEQCNVTQPALSRAIQQLEDEVGGLLFRRERNTTHLTDLGMLMKPRLQEVMDKLVAARQEAHKFLTLENANVTLGIMCSVGPTRFTGMLGDFKVRFPGICLRLIEGSASQLGMRLEAGEIDVAIMANPESYSERFHPTPLYRERFLIAFAPGHRFELFDAIPIAEVDKENYLRRLNCEYRDTLSSLIKAHDCSINVCFQSEREDWIQNMVAAGLGICFIPEFSAVMPGILTRPVVRPEVCRDICLVSMAGRRLSPAVLSFINSVKRYPWPESPVGTRQAVA